MGVNVRVLIMYVFKIYHVVGPRSFRYKQNCTVLQRGMEELGFCKLLSRDCGGYIITTYHYPNHPNFNFEEFYCKLCQLGGLHVQYEL